MLENYNTSAPPPSGHTLLFIVTQPQFPEALFYRLEAGLLTEAIACRLPERC